MYHRKHVVGETREKKNEEKKNMRFCNLVNFTQVRHKTEIAFDIPEQSLYFALCDKRK